MATPAVTADEVGQILLYVAPGFLARAAYRYRFPRRRRTDFDVLIVSVVASVPLLAAGNALADGLGVERDVTDLAYVLLVLGVAVVAGYLAALARSSARARRALSALGFRHAPEHSVSEFLLASLPEDALVYVGFKDGSTVAGNPSAWTLDPEADHRELYLRFPQWWAADAQRWEAPDDRGGLLIDLAEVHDIQIPEDPVRIRAAAVEPAVG